MGKKLIIPPPTEKTVPYKPKLVISKNGHKPKKRKRNSYNYMLSRIRRFVR